MSEDRRPRRAVLVSLKKAGPGYVISLDDAVEGALSDQWKLAEHITRKDVPQDRMESLSFTEEDLAGLGYYVLARLNAFRSLGEV
jgi:hypothetical protein